MEAGYENSKTQAHSSKAVTSGSDVKGNLTVNARDKLTQQGAQHSVGGTYQENAAGVDHLAAADTASSSTTKTDVGVNIGANVDYSAVTRPVERASARRLSWTPPASSTTSAASARLTSAWISAHRAAAAKTQRQLAGGGQLGESRQHRHQRHRRSARSGHAISGEQRRGHADSGQPPQRSRDEPPEEQNRDTRGSAGVRVYTSTGSDLTVDAKGEGGTQRSNSSASRAVTGSIDAASGINVNVKQDAVYQGTALNGGSGKTTVNAGGDIRFDQASDKQSENHSGFNVKASAKGGFTADSKNFGAGFGGGTRSGENSGSTAQVGNVSGQQGVELNAGRDLTLKGTDVKSGRHHPERGQQGHAAGGGIDPNAQGKPTVRQSRSGRRQQRQQGKTGGSLCRRRVRHRQGE